MKTVFILLFIAVILGGYYYVFYRLWHMMPPTLTGRILLVTVAVLSFLFIAIGIAGRGALPIGLTSFAYIVGTSWLIVFLYLFLIFGVLDLIRITHLLPVGRIMYNSWIGLGSVVLFITVLLSIGYYRYIHKDRVEIRIPVAKKLDINGKNSLKIVAVSDLHLGYSIGNKELESWVDLINREKPDVVLIGGDITDNNVQPLLAHDMAAPFHRIEAPLGVYTIMGNHEYIANAKDATAFFKSAGLKLLRDSVTLINNSFYIAGRDDRSNPDRQSIEKLIASIDKNKPVILLDHQPTNLDEAMQNGIDFQFSGHTHGGQVWPISWITNFLFEIDHGYLKKGDTHVYVSSGLGIWGGKFRIGTRSEYVVIHLEGE